MFQRAVQYKTFQIKLQLLAVLKENLLKKRNNILYLCTCTRTCVN